MKSKKLKLKTSNIKRKKKVFGEKEFQEWLKMVLKQDGEMLDELAKY